MTVDNTITNHSVEKGNDSNWSKKMIIKRRGKRLVIKRKIQYYRNKRKGKRKKRSIFVTRIYLNGQLKLEDYGMKICTNKLHHLCQNNIDHVSFDSKFEKVYGNAFRCSKCYEECM